MAGRHEFGPSHQGNLEISAGHPLLDGLPELLMYGDVRHQQAEPRLTPHRNDGIEVCLCRTGVYRWNVEGRETEIRPGELSVTLPWQVHSGVNNILGPGHLSWIILAADGSAAEGFRRGPLSAVFADQAGDVLGPLGQLTTPYLGRKPELEHLFDQIDEELRGTAVARSAMIRSLVATLLIIVSRTASTPPADATADEFVPSRVLAVLDAVRDNPQSQWSASEMAEQSGMGHTAFTEWCRRATGRSPRWYLLEQRLEAARAQLAGDESITSIAFENGFSSSQHFASAFKRLYGSTPSDYRRRTGEGHADSGTSGM